VGALMHSLYVPNAELAQVGLGRCQTDGFTSSQVNFECILKLKASLTTVPFFFKKISGPPIFTPARCSSSTSCPASVLRVSLLLVFHIIYYIDEDLAW
jgi:hypothetical protein